MLPTMSTSDTRGSITGTMQSAIDLGTLDEPVSETIMRDVRLVVSKLLIVLVPRNSSDETLKALRDCT